MRSATRMPDERTSRIRCRSSWPIMGWAIGTVTAVSILTLILYFPSPGGNFLRRGAGAPRAHEEAAAQRCGFHRPAVGGPSLLHDHPPPRQHEDEDEEDQRDDDLRLTLVAPQARQPLPHDDLQPSVHAVHLPHHHPHPQGKPVRRDWRRTPTAPRRAGPPRSPRGRRGGGARR